MKQFFMVFSCILIIPLLITLFFFSNIKGYYRFKNYCSSEGGLHVYEKLEKNVAWWAKDKYEARELAILPEVGQVFFKDESNKFTYELKYTGGSFQSESSYSVTSADYDKEVRYEWKKVNQAIPDESRLRLYGNEVYKTGSEKPIVMFYAYGYELFDRNKTIFDAPSEYYCHVDDSALQLDQLSLALKKIKEAF